MASSSSALYHTSDLSIQDFWLDIDDFDPSYARQSLTNDLLLPPALMSEGNVFSRDCLNHIELANPLQSHYSSLGRDVTFMNADQTTPTLFLDTPPHITWPTGELATSNKHARSPLSATRRAFVEAKATQDQRSVSIQEKRRDASIDCFLQMRQKDDSEYHNEELLHRTRHRPATSRLPCRPLSREDGGVSQTVFEDTSVWRTNTCPDGSGFHPSMPMITESSGHPEDSNEHHTTQKSTPKRTPGVRSFESVWTSTFEPHDVRRLHPKTRAEREAYSTLRRNGGACDRHRKSKKAVSVPLSIRNILHFLIHVSVAVVNPRVAMNMAYEPPPRCQTQKPTKHLQHQLRPSITAF
jgi:hypothetical protein